MAVNLSPYGGVGAQFLDNSGNVLTGGKIFTYSAGTTTPQTTYTTSAGNIPHSNPIILDASGRVPSGGEIWLTDGSSYKFILRDSNDVLIATYDNVTGINSNFVAFTNQQEIQTATAGQTVFNLTTVTYQPATNSLTVFVDGVNQYGPGAQYAYFETDNDTVTFVNGLHVGAEVKFTTSQLNSNASQSDAFQVSYTPPFTNSVGTNVGDKLAQTVSVMDFGAVGDGVTDDTTAIQAAHNAAREVLYPAGTYNISASIVLPSGAIVIGQGSGSGGATVANSTIINMTTSAFAYVMDAPLTMSVNTVEGPRFSDIQINCQNGVRLNTIAGGQPGHGGTQGFINNASFKKVFINQNNTIGTGTALQASVCFHLEFTEQSETLGFEYHLDFYYSDFVLVSHCRLWQFSKALVRLTAANTFGSHSIIEKNDLLAGSTGATAFMVLNDYSPTVRNNYIEQTAVQGTGFTAAIVASGNTSLTIQDNVVTFPLACGPNWLNVTNTISLALVYITNNKILAFPTSVIPPAIFNNGLGLEPYSSGGNSITACIHNGNTSEIGMPFNSITSAEAVPSVYNQLAILTPNVRFAIENYFGLPGYINNNQFVMPPTSGGNAVYWSDPSNTFASVAVDIYVLAYAAGSQTINIAAVNNYASNIANINANLTTKPTWFQVASNITAAAALKILFTNNTSGGANNAYIMSVVINAH
jgi:hypothetical protein